MTERIDSKETMKQSKTGSRKASLYPYDITPKHYKDFKIEPFKFIHQNGLGFAEGNVVKYICRWRGKGGVDDLKKAIRYIELLIEGEEDESDS